MQAVTDGLPTLIHQLEELNTHKDKIHRIVLPENSWLYTQTARCAATAGAVISSLILFSSKKDLSENSGAVKATCSLFAISSFTGFAIDLINHQNRKNELCSINRSNLLQDIQIAKVCLEFAKTISLEGTLREVELKKRREALELSYCARHRIKVDDESEEEDIKKIKTRPVHRVLKRRVPNSINDGGDSSEEA